MSPPWILLPPGHDHDASRLDRPGGIQPLEEGRHAAVHEHERVGLGLFGIDPRLGHHHVQPTAADRHGVVYRHAQATAQGVRDEHVARHAGYLHVRYTHDVFHGCPLR
jgi:hypothetical protein